VTAHVPAGNRPQLRLLERLETEISDLQRKLRYAWEGEDAALRERDEALTALHHAREAPARAPKDLENIVVHRTGPRTWWDGYEAGIAEGRLQAGHDADEGAWEDGWNAGYDVAAGERLASLQPDLRPAIAAARAADRAALRRLVDAASSLHDELVAHRDPGVDDDPLDLRALTRQGVELDEAIAEAKACLELPNERPGPAPAQRWPDGLRR